MRLLIGSSLLLPILLFAAFPTFSAETRGVIDARAEIVIIGASYAKDWPATTLAGRPIRNQGMGGDETSGMLARFERDVIAHRPSTVIIWGFINDIFRSSADTLPTKIEVTKINLTRMVQLARAHGISPVLATEVTIRGPKSLKDTVLSWVGQLRGKRSYAQNINDHVLRVNDWLRGYAHANRIPLLDLQPVLSEPDGMRRKDYAVDDGSHLSAAAYDALTRFADPVLTRQLARMTSPAPAPR